MFTSMTVPTGRIPRCSMATVPAPRRFQAAIGKMGLEVFSAQSATVLESDSATAILLSLDNRILTPKVAWLGVLMEPNRTEANKAVIRDAVAAVKAAKGKTAKTSAVLENNGRGARKLFLDQREVPCICGALVRVEVRSVEYAPQQASLWRQLVVFEGRCACKRGLRLAVTAARNP